MASEQTTEQMWNSVKERYVGMLEQITIFSNELDKYSGQFLRIESEAKEKREILESWRITEEDAAILSAARGRLNSDDRDMIMVNKALKFFEGANEQTIEIIDALIRDIPSVRRKIQEGREKLNNNINILSTGWIKELIDRYNAETKHDDEHDRVQANEISEALIAMHEAHAAIMKEAQSTYETFRKTLNNIKENIEHVEKFKQEYEQALMSIGRRLRANTSSAPAPPASVQSGLSAVDLGIDDGASVASVDSEFGVPIADLNTELQAQPFEQSGTAAPGLATITDIKLLEDVEIVEEDRPRVSLEGRQFYEITADHPRGYQFTYRILATPEHIASLQKGVSAVEVTADDPDQFGKPETTDDHLIIEYNGLTILFPQQYA